MTLGSRNPAELVSNRFTEYLSRRNLVRLAADESVPRKESFNCIFVFEHRDVACLRNDYITLSIHV